MTEFVLRGPAQSSFDLVRQSMPAGERLSWDDFQARFLEEYHPESLRERRAIEFEALSCAACGSVDAYTQKVVELCVYAPSLIATERLRVQRFLRGLPPGMQKILLVQGQLSFTAAVDRAWQFERLDGEPLDVDVEGPSK